MRTKLEQCCTEPRGFVGGVCDHCDGTVMPNDEELMGATHKELVLIASQLKTDRAFLIRGISQELIKNSHLADGEQCTLIGLKNMLRTLWSRI